MRVEVFMVSPPESIGHLALRTLSSGQCNHLVQTGTNKLLLPPHIPVPSQSRLCPVRIVFASAQHLLSHRWRRQTGQALAELTTALLVIIILVLGAATLASLCMKQQLLRRDVRAEAGHDALRRSTTGWVDEIQQPENRSDAFHRINAYVALDTYDPVLPSRLPASNYTLAARDLPEAELGLKTALREETVPLDGTFIRLIYGKETVRLHEEIVFPATSGLWK